MTVQDICISRYQYLNRDVSNAPVFVSDIIIIHGSFAIQNLVMILTISNLHCKSHTNTDNCDCTLCPSLFPIYLEARHLIQTLL